MVRVKKPKISCRNCGYENRAKARFCNLCKEILPKAEPVAEVEAAPRPFGQDATPEAPSVEQTPQAEPAPELDKGAQAPPASPPSEAMAFTGESSGERYDDSANLPARRTTFYEEKSSNITNSNLLLLCLIFTLTALGGSIGGIYGVHIEGAIVAFVIGSGLGAVSWFSGSSVILSMSGAKKIDYHDHPQLYNVCEEMKIASGIPMPDIYLIDSAAPNAFATGRDPDKAAVAVTTGLLEKLNRDELQGVIAHEFGHIRNFDIRYAMLASILVGSIALISDAFLRGGLRSSGRSGGGPMIVLAIVLAILAPISAYMLQMAISRRREFLADATAVEFTRNPEGLASALAKIASDPAPLKSSNRATQHLYIINPVKNFKMNSRTLFSTHPPTKARLHALKRMGAS